MKHAELMNEIERAYNTFLANNPGHSEVDFDSFLIGYTTCMTLRSHHQEDSKLLADSSLRQMADYLKNPIADSSLQIVDPKIYIAFILQSSLNDAYTISNSDPDHNIWDDLYHRVFSDEVSMTIFRMFPDFDYYDPDTSYYEDVVSFINAFDKYAKGE